MSSFDATFSGEAIDLKNGVSNDTIEITIQVPADYGAGIVLALGWPTRSRPVPVSISRQPREPIIAVPPPDEVRLPNHASLLCTKLEFKEFVYQHVDYVRSRQMSVEEFVKEICSVKDLSEIRPNTESGWRWEMLVLEYGRWLNRR